VFVAYAISGACFFFPFPSPFFLFFFFPPYNVGSAEGFPRSL